LFAEVRTVFFFVFQYIFIFFKYIYLGTGVVSLGEYVGEIF